MNEKVHKDLIDRPFNKKDKETVFESAKIIEGFDSKYFRYDILGKIIIKDINRLDKKRGSLAGEVEHVHSSCYGGESNPSNGVMLNAYANNSKKQTPLYLHTINEIRELRNNYGVSLSEIQNDISKFSERYNLDIIKNTNGEWSLQVIANNKSGKNIYKPHHKDKDDFYNIRYSENIGRFVLPEDQKEKFRENFIITNPQIVIESKFNSKNNFSTLEEKSGNIQSKNNIGVHCKPNNPDIKYSANFEKDLNTINYYQERYNHNSLKSSIEYDKIPQNSAIFGSREEPTFNKSKQYGIHDRRYNMSDKEIDEMERKSAENFVKLISWTIGTITNLFIDKKSD